MPNVNFICEYCGHKWNNYLWGQSQIAEERCRGCKGKATEYHPKDVYGYNYEKKQQLIAITKSDVFGYDKK